MVKWIYEKKTHAFIALLAAIAIGFSVGKYLYQPKSFPRPLQIVIRTQKVRAARTTQPTLPTTTTATMTPAIEETEIAIAIAIAEEPAPPDEYTQSKNQLFSLLIKEIKDKEDVDPELYEELYDQLLEFEGINPEDEDLDLPAEELVGTDRDLIHIPFLRYLALDDLDNLEDAALEYVEAFPESYIGHVYLAEAYWKQDEQEAALETLRQVGTDEERDQLILFLMNRFKTDPLQRILDLAD